MSIIQEKANQIASDMEANKIEHRLAFDPMLILTIFGIILNLIQVYQGCRQSPKEAAVSMRSGGILERWRLRRTIRQHIDDPEMNDHIGGSLFSSTLKVASTVTDEDVAAMYEEASHQPC